MNFKKKLMDFVGQEEANGSLPKLAGLGAAVVGSLAVSAALASTAEAAHSNSNHLNRVCEPGWHDDGLYLPSYSDHSNGPVQYCYWYSDHSNYCDGYGDCPF